MNLIKKYAYGVFKSEALKYAYSNTPYFIEQKNLISLFFKRLKRDISLFVFGQFRLLHTKMPKKGAKILWINRGMPQVGDALSDLSCRVMLDPKDYDVDLYSEPIVCSLFKDDPYFKNVSDNIDTLLSNRYDFVIMSGYSWKSVKVKVFHLKSIPFFSIYKHYNGPEFNRITFAYHALFLALRTKNDRAHELLKTYPTFFNLKYSHTKIKRKKNQIAIVIGGVVTERIYKKWTEVIKELFKNFSNINIVLLGSSNGLHEARKIKAQFHSKKIKNLVGITKLHDVFDVLKESAVMICADGGLLHIGRAAKVPTLALFTGDIHPLMRFDKTDPVFAIYKQSSVSDIPPQIIIDEYRKLAITRQSQLKMVFMDTSPFCSLN